VHDGADLRLRQRHARLQREQHGGCRLVGVVGEHVFRRDREVDHRGLHALDRLEGLAELTLQRPLIGHVLLEVGRRHALLVEQ
jgi:hypothetical protein